MAGRGEQWQSQLVRHIAAVGEVAVAAEAVAVAGERLSGRWWMP